MDKTLDVHISKLPNNGVSDALSFKYTPKTGKRWAVATRNIKPAEVLINVKPYATMLCVEDIYTHCGRCFKEAWTSIPCKYCVHVVYCSKECMDAAWEEYHDIECLTRSNIKNVKSMETAFLALKTTILGMRELEGIDNMKSELLELDDAEGMHSWTILRLQNLKTNYNMQFTVSDCYQTLFDENGNLYHDRFTSVVTLCDNDTSKDDSTVCVRALLASYVVYFLTTKTNFFGKKLNSSWMDLAKNEDTALIAGLLFKQIKGLSRFQFRVCIFDYGYCCIFYIFHN